MDYCSIIKDISNDAADGANFIEGICKYISGNYSFSGKGEGIVYYGNILNDSASDTSAGQVWKLVDSMTQSGDYYYISSTEGGDFLNKNEFLNEAAKEYYDKYLTEDGLQELKESILKKTEGF